ncbi:MAG: hypothetical protein ILP10_01675 [Lachnospiraceae bacterium]|nr:hypothetical protein [Lachnospiraceae bacterium]
MWTLVANLAVLAALSVEDIRKRRLVLWHILAGTAVMVGTAVILDGLLLWERIPGMLPGLSLMGLSKLTGGKIGMADGMLIGAIGLATGMIRGFYILSWTVMTAGVFAAVMWISGKLGRKDSFPLVPFMLAGYVCHLLIM